MYKLIIGIILSITLYGCIIEPLDLYDVIISDYTIKNSSSYVATLNLYSQHKLRHSESMDPGGSILRKYYRDVDAHYINWSVDSNYVGTIDSITIDFDKERIIYGFSNDYSPLSFLTISVSRGSDNMVRYPDSLYEKYAIVRNYPDIALILSDSTYDHAMVIEDSIDNEFRRLIVN